MSEKLRAAVVGAGRMGMIHGHLLQVHPETELAGFVDRDQSLAAHLASQGLRAPLHPSIDALVAAGKPDAFFICTPTHTHLPVVRECLKHRAHLFVEKPLATTLDECRAIADAVARAGVCARVYDMPPPRGTTASPAARAILTTSTTSSVLPGWTTATGVGTSASVKSAAYHRRSASPVSTCASPRAAASLASASVISVMGLLPGPFGGSPTAEA